MNLFELLQQPLPYQLVRSQSDRAVYAFEVGPKDVVAVYIEEDGEDVWEITFARGKPGVGGDYHVNGQGGAPQVLATVLEIMKQFVSSHRPKAITFTSNKGEASRTALYQRMVVRYARSFGYKQVTDLENHPAVPSHMKINGRTERFFLVPA